MDLPAKQDLFLTRIVAIGRGDQRGISRIAARRALWVSLLVFPFALVFFLLKKRETANSR